jgi:hypothetical protein
VADSGITRADLAVYGAVLDHINGRTGTAWPSINSIAKAAGVNRATAVRSIARLVASVYLKCESGNSRKSNVYRIGLGRCVAAPRGDEAPRCEAAPSVGAAPRLEVGAAPRLELIDLNSSKELIEKALSANEDNRSRFPEFWEAYPRKVGDKKGAQRNWTRKKLDKIADQIIADVQARTAQDPRWRDLQFIPHPTTYLHQERWNDDWQPAGAVPARPSVTAPISGKTFEGSSDERIEELFGKRAG